MANTTRVKSTEAPTAPRCSRRSSLAGVFQPILGSRAMLEVADQLTMAIMGGYFREGERLPTVDKLATAMRVSKPTVGEAVRLLAEEGVLEARRGATGGIIVTSSVIPVPLLTLTRRQRGRTLGEVVEARRPIELQLARFAAVRATDEDFEALEAANEYLIASRGDDAQWAQANNLFHIHIGRAARTELLASFQFVILQELALLLDGYSDEYADADRTIREHVSSLEALRTRDPDRAEATMDEHLREFEELAPRFDQASTRRCKRPAAVAPRRPSVRRPPA
jgi:GntR family transcriptional repressor for pyruvate dehydrogenase complex